MSGGMPTSDRTQHKLPCLTVRLAWVAAKINFENQPRTLASLLQQGCLTDFVDNVSSG